MESKERETRVPAVSAAFWCYFHSSKTMVQFDKAVEREENLASSKCQEMWSSPCLLMLRISEESGRMGGQFVVAETLCQLFLEFCHVTFKCRNHLFKHKLPFLNSILSDFQGPHFKNTTLLCVPFKFKMNLDILEIL